MTDNTVADTVNFWMTLLTAMFAIVVFAHRWIAVRAAALCLSFKRMDEVVVPDGECVMRESLEGDFFDAIKSALSETVLLYGQRGSGKNVSYPVCSERLKGHL
jgi:hypothetical protein